MMGWGEAVHEGQLGFSLIKESADVQEIGLSLS